MVVFPILAMAFSLACAAISGWDAVKRPKPERIVWTVAFLLFAVAAGSEVAGSVAAWTPLLARVYYLTGAVLVVGLLALGELYLLFGPKMPAIAPGVTLLVVALATTLVWGAPVDQDLLASAGWSAIEKGPALIVLAASINIVGTVVLCGGALWSAWRLRAKPEMTQRAVGCALIALGALIVAMGGTLTRLGQREYLYLAMTLGIATIFAGILQTRRGLRTSTAAGMAQRSTDPISGSRPRLTLLGPGLVGDIRSGEGINYIVDQLLSLSEADLEQKVRDWGATIALQPPLDRTQAARVWKLRCELPLNERPLYDRLPLGLQAQIAELHAEIWADQTERTADMQRA